LVNAKALKFHCTMITPFYIKITPLTLIRQRRTVFGFPVQQRRLQPMKRDRLHRRLLYVQHIQQTLKQYVTYAIIKMIQTHMKIEFVSQIGLVLMLICKEF